MILEIHHLKIFSRLSIFAKFIILASSLFAILAVIVLFVSNIIIRNSFIDRSKSAVASVIQFEARDLRAEDFSLKDPDHAKIVFNSLYEKVRSSEILRIKVWDYSAKIIFSDDESIIGQRFPDNNEFKEALKGKIVTELGQKTKAENISEQGYEQLLEVYVPITFKGENVPSGVIEAYFKLDGVNERIKETQIILIVTIITFTLVSIGLLFLIFKLIIYKQIEKINLQAVALDDASDHVIITDPEGVILYVNKAAEILTGYSKSEMIGNRPSLWGKQMPKEFYEKMWRIIKTEKRDFKNEIKNRRKDGTEYDAEVKISPVLGRNNNIDFFVGIERDITKEKQVDRAKTEFVSLASHQLRTPLSTINWYAEMLLSPGGSPLSQGQKTYVMEIAGASKRMVKLVNALLDISHIEFGTFTIKPEPVNPKKITEMCLKELMPEILKKKLKLTVKYDASLPVIQSDPKLLEIILTNLLTNSIKFTPAGGRIKLSVDKGKSDIIVTVSDTGLGIPKEAQAHVFEKLFRAENIKKTDIDGTGLGLYIVKAIVDQLGGKIWFESFAPPGSKGTTFYVVLPYDQNNINS